MAAAAETSMRPQSAKMKTPKSLSTRSHRFTHPLSLVLKTPKVPYTQWKRYRTSDSDCYTVYTRFVPHYQAEDDYVWNRVHGLRCERSYVIDQEDPTIHQPDTPPSFPRELKVFREYICSTQRLPRNNHDKIVPSFLYIPFRIE